MNYITTLLSSIKLTLIQWTVLVLAGVIGFLVIKLRLQGSTLHAAQVALLKVQYDAAMATQDASVAQAQADYNQALSEYQAGK